MGELYMKSILKRGGFGALMAAMLWGVTGCPALITTRVDDQTFDELRTEEITVRAAYIEEPYTKLYPYGLVISINTFPITRKDGGFFPEKDGTEGPYAFYSDEKCTVRLQEDTLVTINREPPSALYRTMSDLGGEFEVYLDVLPQEGDLAVFNPKWFFAKSYDYPYYRHKMRIVTESMPIQYRFTGEDPIDNRTFDELPVIEYEVTEVIVRPYTSGMGGKPWYYTLRIYMRPVTGGGRSYRYFSDEACEYEIAGDMLVTVDGKKLIPRYSGYTRIHEDGFSFSIDFPPQEGAVAEFHQEWFFAKPDYYPRYREKVRIITGSMPIEKKSERDR
jgi:hypothetical protein